MQKTRNQALLAAIAIAGLMASFGCDHADPSALDTASENRPAGHVVASGDGARVVAHDEQGNEYAVDTRGADVPADWPRDIPVIPGAKITAHARSEKATTLVLQVAQKPQRVIEYYEGELSDMARKSFKDSAGKLTLVLASKEGTRQVMVSANEPDIDGKVAVHLAVNQGKASE